MHFTVLNLSYLGNLSDFCFANAFFHNSKFSGQSLEAWITDLFTGHCFNGFFTNIFYVDIELLKIHFILFRDFLTDLLSFFSLSWFWKLLVLNKVFKARTKLSRCKCENLVGLFSMTCLAWLNLSLSTQYIRSFHELGIPVMNPEEEIHGIL